MTPVLQIEWLITGVSDKLGIANVKKKNGYKKSIIYKVFKRITNNHDFPLGKKQTITTDSQYKETREFKYPGAKRYQWKKILI